MNPLDKQYQDLLQTILDYGIEKKDRTGTGTKSIFGYTIRHNMKNGFPLLTTKKMAWKTMVTELIWFLRGDTNIKYLVDNNCHIWDGDAYKNYQKSVILSHKENGLEGFDYLDKESFIDRIKIDSEFAKKWGELGPIYGKQWRDWGADHNGPGEDQIANLISELKTNPDSRRLLVSAWNTGEISEMVLPPCHYGFQVYTRELSSGERRDWVIKNRSVQMPKFFDRLGWEGNVAEVLEKFNAPTRAISLMWNQRSVDTGLGLSFNIASYSLLLMMIAKQVNMVPDEVIGNLGDVHLYLNHIEPIKEQLTREPYPLPTVKISDKVVNDISEYTLDDIILENYQSHPTIKMPLSN